MGAEYDRNEDLLHERVLKVCNVSIPPYIIVNYAIRKTKITSDLKEGETPLSVLVNSYTDAELAAIVQKIDDEYANSPVVVEYILAFLKDMWPDADRSKIKQEYEILSRSLPVTIQRMNACENYKLCFYIASQRREAGYGDEDVSAGLMGDSQAVVAVYARLCENLNANVPLDVATYEAGTYVNKDARLTPEDLDYDYNKTAEDNFQSKCGDVAIEIAKRPFEKVTSIAKEAIGISSLVTDKMAAEILQEEAANGANPNSKQAAAQLSRRQSLYLISYAITLVLAVTSYVAIGRLGFCFQSFLYVLSVCASLLGCYTSTKQKQSVTGFLVTIIGLVIFIFAVIQ